MHTRLRFAQTAVAALILCASFLMAEPWWTDAPGAYPEPVEEILGEAAGWQVLDRYSRPTEAVLESTDVGPVLTAGGAYLSLRRTALIAENTEVEARFRLVPPEGKSIYFMLDTPREDLVDQKDRGLWFSASTVYGRDFMTVSAYDPALEEEARPYISASYYPKGNTARSLAWPESVRKRVEHQLSSLPEVSEKWMTVRMVLGKESLRVEVNGGTLLDRRKDGLEVGGMLRINMSEGCQLASVRIRRIAPPDPVFEPVVLEDALNADGIGGESLAMSSLPEAGREVLVDGALFRMARPDIQGNMCIDLGQSWFQAANMKGHLSGHRGLFGGRWRDAYVRNPARIQFRVPPGRYRALHLVAAADGDDLTVPVVTAQFYRPGAGFPESFAGTVPAFNARALDGSALPIQLANGKTRTLHHVVIPIEPGSLKGFDDVGFTALELTKAVQLWRAYPDPSYYSVHAGGLPSSVRVLAATLERPAVDMKVESDAFANTWTDPQRPVYTVTLLSRTEPKRSVELIMTTAGYGGIDTSEDRKTVELLPGRPARVKFMLKPGKYGFHHVNLKLVDGEQEWNEKLNMAYLQKDTRDRGDWELGRGPLFGFWNWNGGHHTPPPEKQTLIMAIAGAESRSGSFEQCNDEEKKLAEQYNMFTMKHFSSGDHWATSALMKDLRTMTEEEAVAKFVAALEKTVTKPSKITRPRYISFFAEPHVGPITYGNLPEYYGEPTYVLTESERARFDDYLKAILVGVPAVKKRWPDAKVMMPHGDPLFTVLFLRESEEVRKLVDGLAYDNPVFERLPEHQAHQVAIHRLWQVKKEFEKYGMKDMLMPMYEGPAHPARPGGLTPEEQAFLGLRSTLILIGYGVDQMLGGWCPFEAGSYWGEQHYGGGIIERVPIIQPKPQYAVYATMTRQLNRRNFVKYVPTGSTATYAMQFRHYKDESLLHVMWTVRGVQPVTLAVPDKSVVTVYDMMDNAVHLKGENGKGVSLALTPEPFYVAGLPDDVQITLGPADHTDSQPAQHRKLLANIGSGDWHMSEDRDLAYEDNNHLQMHRFPGRMSVREEGCPADKGDRALAVHLEKQDTQRWVMPFYTTLAPRKPVTIAGKASHLGLWVKADGDWGRVVYSVRDANGERWMSIGTREDFNCDDTHNWSVFCFNGWRYLRFELPSQAPYDLYRENGTTWWGSFGEGDGIVDLPLSLEKIIVERRTHVIYGNDLIEAPGTDVLLGDLYAEYADSADMEKAVVKLSRVRMPVPEGVPDLGNPVLELAQSAELPAPAISKTSLPDQVADGTRCHVHFDAVEGAATYDVWVSPYPDGQGALLLGKGWTESGQLLTGLRPETDFYLFLGYQDAEGRQSKPSQAHKILLHDIFVMK